jgi:hypothetical protein
VVEGRLPIRRDFATRQLVTIGPNCELIFSAIEFIPVDQIPTVPLRTGDVRVAVDPGTKGPGARAPLRWHFVPGELHVRVNVLEIAQQVMTGIDTHNLYYSFSGGSITSVSRDSTIRYNRETNQCGGIPDPGWNPNWAATYITTEQGGVGSPWVVTRTHAEFSYRGYFDCSGTQYYNILDAWASGEASGDEPTCSYRTWFRNTAPGWSVDPICWDAQPHYKTPTWNP